VIVSMQAGSVRNTASALAAATPLNVRGTVVARDRTITAGRTISKLNKPQPKLILLLKMIPQNSIIM